MKDTSIGMPMISEGLVQVFTFKTGVLSRVAHDLRFTLGRFEIQVEGEQVRARFWPDSLRVDGAMHKDTLDPSDLGDSDKAEIQLTLRTKILRTLSHSEVRLEAAATPNALGYELDGTLEIVGRKQPIRFPVASEEGRLRGEVELQPLRWGIAPYKALLGAIKLQDRVLVRFDIPAPQ
ncbi:MAG TPA: YceI family protein [Polyangiaceae bacterium]|nr:YceI family protein [Polyangiaceae bacterium]